MGKHLQLFFALLVVVISVGCTKEASTQRVNPSLDKSDGAIGKQGGLRSGMAAPEFSVTDLAGNTVALSSYQDKVVLLNFWATWCIPCVAEMPALERLYKLYHEQGFVIAAISVDQDKELVSRFVEENGITFPVLLDPAMTTPVLYEVMGFPETFFIDGAGKFFEIKDPETRETGIRVISDRPWDAQVYAELLGNIIKEHRNPTK